MKKILLGTTAIIALSTFSAEAFAAEKIKLELGGFMRHYVGLTNHDEVAVTALSAETRGIDLGMHANTEVYFRGNTTLDNGLNVAVDIQMEADKSQARRTDKSYVTISSDGMGALSVGSIVAAADDFLVRVPQAAGLDWSDAYGYGSVAGVAGASATAFAAQSAVDVEDGGNSDGKLKYVSPSFSGLSVVASFTPANGGGSDLTGGTNASTEEIAYGAKFDGELGGAAVSAGVGTLHNDGSFKKHHFGLSVGMAGFTIAGGYTDQNDDLSGATARLSSNDGKAYEIGVGFEQGPYTVTAGYMRTESKGTIANVADNVDKHWAVAGAYDLGAGVKLVADYWHAKSESEDVAINAADGSVSGLIAGIEVGF